MPVKTRQCYLTTSPEKFQQEGGSGSCNTDSPTPTGVLLLAGPKPTNDSSSPSETPPFSQLEDTCPSCRDIGPCKNPKPCQWRAEWYPDEDAYPLTPLEKEAKALYLEADRYAELVPWEDLPESHYGLRSFWVKRALDDRKKRTILEEDNPESGTSTVTEADMLAFWNRRREVPSKP